MWVREARSMRTSEGLPLPAARSTPRPRARSPGPRWLGALPNGALNARCYSAAWRPRRTQPRGSGPRCTAPHLSQPDWQQPLLAQRSLRWASECSLCSGLSGVAPGERCEPTRVKTHLRSQQHHGLLAEPGLIFLHREPASEWGIQREQGLASSFLSWIFNRKKYTYEGFVVVVFSEFVFLTSFWIFQVWLQSSSTEDHSELITKRMREVFIPPLSSAHHKLRTSNCVSGSAFKGKMGTTSTHIWKEDTWLKNSRAGSRAIQLHTTATSLPVFSAHGLNG